MKQKIPVAVLKWKKWHTHDYYITLLIKWYYKKEEIKQDLQWEEKNPHHPTSIATWLEAISGWMTREACVQIGIHIA